MSTIESLTICSSSYVNGQDIAVDGGLSASLPVMPNSPAGSGTSLVRSKLA